MSAEVSRVRNGQRFTRKILPVLFRSISAMRILRHLGLFLAALLLSWLAFVFIIAISWTGPDGNSSRTSRVAFAAYEFLVSPWRWLPGGWPMSIGVAFSLAI